MIVQTLSEFDIIRDKWNRCAEDGELVALDAAFLCLVVNRVGVASAKDVVNTDGEPAVCQKREVMAWLDVERCIYTEIIWQTVSVTIAVERYEAVLLLVEELSDRDGGRSASAIVSVHGEAVALSELIVAYQFQLVWTVILGIEPVAVVDDSFFAGEILLLQFGA